MGKEAEVEAALRTGLVKEKKYKDAEKKKKQAEIDAASAKKKLVAKEGAEKKAQPKKKKPTNTAEHKGVPHASRGAKAVHEALKAAALKAAQQALKAKTPEENKSTKHKSDSKHSECV